MDRIQEMVNFWNQDTDHVKDMSHQYKSGRWNYSEWNALGVTMFIRLTHILNITGNGDKHQMSLTEFGCGGGANLHFMQQHSDFHLCGVDISQKTLDAARDGLPDSVNLIHYDPADPAAMIDALPYTADIFLSTYVFQHFPSWEYTEEVLKLMTQMIRVDGVFLVQYRFRKAATSGSLFPGGKYEDQFIRAATFDPQELEDLFTMNGFDVMFTEFQQRDDYCWIGGIRKV